MLRPLSWIQQANAAPGATIPLSLPDIEVEGMAQVVAVEPCPRIQGGRGRVVTATFTQLCPSVLSVTLRGQDTPLEPTAPHRFYSEDRQDWVAARDLRIGERLRTRQGPPAVVESIGAVPGVHRVYNLEVEAEHQFYVGAAGVLVHNTYEGPHTMTGRLVRGAEDIVESEYTSGGIKNGVSSWQEQLKVHTERQFLSEVEPLVQPGDVVKMAGELDPCRPGCQPAISPTTLVASKMPRSGGLDWRKSGVK